MVAPPKVPQVVIKVQAKWEALGMAVTVSQVLVLVTVAQVEELGVCLVVVSLPCLVVAT